MFHTDGSPGWTASWSWKSVMRVWWTTQIWCAISDPISCTLYSISLTMEAVRGGFLFGIIQNRSKVCRIMSLCNSWINKTKKLCVPPLPDICQILSDEWYEDLVGNFSLAAGLTVVTYHRYRFYSDFLSFIGKHISSTWKLYPGEPFFEINKRLIWRSTKMALTVAGALDIWNAFPTFQNYSTNTGTIWLTFSFRNGPTILMETNLIGSPGTTIISWSVSGYSSYPFRRICRVSEVRRWQWFNDIESTRFYGATEKYYREMCGWFRKVTQVETVWMYKCANVALQCTVDGKIPENMVCSNITVLVAISLHSYYLDIFQLYSGFLKNMVMIGLVDDFFTK